MQPRVLTPWYWLGVLLGAIMLLLSIVFAITTLRNLDEIIGPVALVAVLAVLFAVAGSVSIAGSIGRMRRVSMLRSRLEAGSQVNGTRIWYVGIMRSRDRSPTSRHDIAKMGPGSGGLEAPEWARMGHMLVSSHGGREVALEAPGLIVEDDCCRDAMILWLYPAHEPRGGRAVATACRTGIGCARAEAWIEGDTVRWKLSVYSLEKARAAKLYLSVKANMHGAPLPSIRSRILLGELQASGSTEGALDIGGNMVILTGGGGIDPLNVAYRSEGMPAISGLAPRSLEVLARVELVLDVRLGLDLVERAVLLHHSPSSG